MPKEIWAFLFFGVFGALLDAEDLLTFPENNPIFTQTH
jgi:hypothetical protein